MYLSTHFFKNLYLFSIFLFDCHIFTIFDIFLYIICLFTAIYKNIKSRFHVNKLMKTAFFILYNLLYGELTIV